MLKLYKFTPHAKLYWETWENDGVHTVHWGELGTKGQSKELEDLPEGAAQDAIQEEITQRVQEGYAPVDEEGQRVLLIEYMVDGMGSVSDVEKRQRLQERMDETLGWTGVGHCDGGSIGSGSMEVCCFVVDFEVARDVITHDLEGTEFSNYTRIYEENSEN